MGQWGNGTDLALAAGRRPQRTRVDASWLLGIVERAEATPGILHQLPVVANSSAYIRAGRVVLAERVFEGEGAIPPLVSIRATGVVRRALTAARTPIRYRDLAAGLLEATPGATADQVEALLAQLCAQSLLVSQLRPPLTIAHPARHVLAQLAPIPEACELRAHLQEVVDAAAGWDTATTATEDTFRALVVRAGAVAPFERSPFQVDAGLALGGVTVSREVASEAARAAELLLGLSPSPRGPSHLDAYRRLFEHRYGRHRPVPLLEMLDPNIGLGPPPGPPPAPPPPAGPQVSGLRARTLLELATTALRERTSSVDLDDSTVRRLATGELTVATAPLSVDLTVVVAAESKVALDAGHFELAIGPIVGSMAAGRLLGRFADFTPGADAALAQIAAREIERTPGRIMAELTYAPRSRRLENVSTRPNHRPYEIAVGITSGADPARTIPIDELLVATRGDRFVIRWAATGDEVVVTTGHMLSYARAPLVCRFLSEVGRDGVCQLSGFQWGPAAAFPYLPRVRSGA